MSETPRERMVYVDMTDQSLQFRDFPDEWKLLGGRALSAKLLLAECDPGCDPLGPDNVLVIAPGSLAGSAAPSSGRLSVGCKSPLTGGIKESNAGGEPAQHLARLGYRAIVIKGQPRDGARRFGLEIDASGVRIASADDYKGMWNYAVCHKLLAGRSRAASAISIGPAGELMLAGASVACTDKSRERNPARHAARGGPGAVMGSKGLKWIVIDPARVKGPEAADAQGFKALCKSFSKSYLASGTYQMFKHGTSAAVPIANVLHTFPYKNRTSGSNPQFEKLDGANILCSFETRGGGMHACQTGCIVRCSNTVHDRDANYLTSALEFETITLLGSCCAINDWEEVAQLDRLCDELGLDTIETGAAIAVLMDSGGMEWGDAAGARRLLQRIAEGDATALAVAQGAAAVGRLRKHARVPVVKGQAVPAWDPRPLKATGVTYASSAMGADHTAGLVLAPDTAEIGLARASQIKQIACAVTDAAGFCMFLSPSMEVVADFYSRLFGEPVTCEQIVDLGWQCLLDEWEFNRRAGLGAGDDDLPACLREEGIGPDGSLKFDVPCAVIDDTKRRQTDVDMLRGASAAG